MNVTGVHNNTTDLEYQVLITLIALIEFDQTEAKLIMTIGELTGYPVVILLRKGCYCCCLFVCLSVVVFNYRIC